MRADHPTDVHYLFEQGTEIDKALSEAARQAREAHRREGVSMPVWRDGKTVWLSPDEIQSDPPRKLKG